MTIDADKRKKPWENKRPSPELMEQITSRLRRGIFRSTVWSVLEIGEEKFNNWMRLRDFRLAVEKAEQQFFESVQERWLAEAQDSLPSARNYCDKRFARELDAASDGGTAPKTVKLVIKKYTTKGIKGT